VLADASALTLNSPFAAASPSSCQLVGNGMPTPAAALWPPMTNSRDSS
jgi:hypothetical protein